ncbi:MAG: NAD(P)-dependent oxidoreductase, partial [Actinobacteria bacterium]
MGTKTGRDSRTRVLVTGAGGYIGSMILPALASRYELRLMDIDEIPERHGITDVVVADLTSPDRSGFAAAFIGIDVVVHLGYVRSSPGGVYDDAVPHLERFETELANVRMAYNVFRCSLESGVRRVVVASSNHAADWYEHALIHRGAMDMVEPGDVPLSDNFYGWSKASYELLAFPFACGTFGRQLEVVMVRIGAPREVDASDHIDRPSSPQPGLPGGTAGLKRHLGAYLSVTDARGIFAAAIEASDVRNEHGV